ncbi:DNA-directed RNA polymerase II subunit GRINL1A-like [Mercenaria mercenaria]|uniref:DNA-directed RNA polymerase II subunit GRINL1A-like n=1 Tax=Mercenaria mercenaria TaxID=6596 RepID=UPI00234F0BC9|nr:DNA-directed RNA polymerase II subunit GRINL1A-like [Mercenaria mercenaria]XP_045216656.2 DNA-directed RNA polymerase II subunit GRINL1A-like [Mercenaria mercenaria]XP_045216657.2 DNA-directed RNA polymerase II subunit GRINL1A-like [Mercenaria mercenaria]XP_045216658.2 DNA-directed RNA polymerase II subunit GRINL1A-like [Mercenaria mercenaria]XP_045216659.2 DNA-directed RNA polymerase II subunit GRINL1A-like [Mercenaria mercenaria]XP_045216660.2 DNA-directed RNA polymerase II subunit GRINL1
MSKAFYPTNDGHIGNLRKLSTIEIQDLLKRQEDLLKKKQSILNKLPDKGGRIKKHLEDLQQELSRRETVNSVKPALQPGDSKQNAQTETLQTDSQMNTNQAEVIESLKLEKEEQKDILLEEELEKLSVKDSNKDEKEKGADDSGKAQKSKHQYEVALERAEKNLQSGLKQPMKLNRALKVEHIEDLPDEIIKMKGSKIVPDSNKQHQSKMECSNLKVNEESAAVPPNYKFSEVKMIDINESLQLQQQQKQTREELNAELAAEKLAERLHIKMEAYNPEGVDMSYRGGQSVEDINSDDDEDDAEAAGYARTMVPSDTED